MLGDSIRSTITVEYFLRGLFLRGAFDKLGAMEVDPLIRWLGRPHEETIGAISCCPHLRGVKLAEILARIEQAEQAGLLVVDRDIRKTTRKWTVSLTAKGYEAARAENAP